MMMGRKHDESEPQVRRGEDLDVSFMGLRLRGTAKAILSLVNGSIGMIALAVAIVYHIQKSDTETTQILEAIWFQTIALSTPQEARAELMKKNFEKMPASVREKMGSKHE